MDDGQAVRAEARRSEYDVVVVGGGMGGLTAGALLARAGKSVVVVDAQARPGGHAHAIREDGRTFDSAVHLITRCGQSVFGTGLVDALLRHLGVRDRCELVRVDPFYRVHLPDLHVTVPTGREAYLAAHAEHFPEEAAGLRHLHELCVQVAREAHGYPPTPSLLDQVLARWRAPTLYRYRNATLAAVVNDELRDPRLKALYAMLWPWVGEPPWRASFVVWAMMIAHYIEDGAYYVRGGFQALADAVAASLERAGGELVCGTRVTRIVVKGQRVRGVVLATGQQLSARVVIANVDPRAVFEELLEPGAAPGYMRRKLRRLDVSPAAYVAYATTDLDVRALGAVHETLTSASWDSRLGWGLTVAGEVPGISITIPTLTDPSLAPAGEHVVILTAFAPAADVPEAEVAERVLQRAEHVLPELRDHLRMVVGAAPHASHLALHRVPAIYGWSVTPQQAGTRRLAQGTPIAGLHLVGQWTRPGHGVGWVMESGLDVAAIVLGRSPASAMLPHELVPLPA